MSGEPLDEERIFHIARGITDAGLRSDYLDQICAGDQALRERVEELLRVHEQEKTFLQSAEPSLPETVEHGSSFEKPGASIGRYRLMEQIGEGGMGTVFVAQQERPIRRKVALKVIKPGMDTKAVVARFEAERQALAMMDHPNIAKVLDAGTTDSGRPYFAMELVKGVPITEYCDRNRLTVPERLEIFIQLCHAIQHAHQKGIIHRDIKPTNILVTLHDGTPVPKVIDFGVAKALNARLTDTTIYTEHLQIVGTLLYMSPEQAELSGLDIDTRSDVYSLGVLLFELLTGTTPFLQADLKKAGLDEQRRMIRDKEAPRASVRLSSLGRTATTVAENRKTDIQKLNKLVRGDLDWIIGKALEKDRTRRYDSASRLAEDVDRYLSNEMVEARPPSTWHQVHKLYARNRGLVHTAAFVFASLAVALTASLYFWYRESVLSSELAQTISSLRVQIVDRALMYAMNGDSQLVEDTLADLRRIEPNPILEEIILGQAYVWSGQVEMGMDHLRSAYEKDPTNYGAVATYALCASSDREAARPIFKAMESIEPQTEIDFLLASNVMPWISPNKAKSYVDKSGKFKSTAFANLCRSLAFMNSALLYQSISDSDMALEFAAMARRQTRDSAISLTMDLICRTVKFELDNGAPSSDMLQEAFEISDRLKTYDDIYFAGRTRSWFLSLYGEKEEAFAAWNARVENGALGTDLGHFASVGLLFGRDDLVKTRMLEQSLNDDVENKLTLAYVLAITDQDDQQVRALCREVIAETVSLEMACESIGLLMLVHDENSAQGALDELARRSDLPARIVRTLDYLAGKNMADDDEYRDAVNQIPTSFDCELLSVYPDFYIGIKRLSDGDTRLAKRSFDACAASGFFFERWYWWAKVFSSDSRLNDLKAGRNGNHYGE